MKKKVLFSLFGLLAIFGLAYAVVPTYTSSTDLSDDNAKAFKTWYTAVAKKTTWTQADLDDMKAWSKFIIAAFEATKGETGGVGANSEALSVFQGPVYTAQGKYLIEILPMIIDKTTSFECNSLWGDAETPGKYTVEPAAKGCYTKAYNAVTADKFVTWFDTYWTAYGKEEPFITAIPSAKIKDLNSKKTEYSKYSKDIKDIILNNKHLNVAKYGSIKTDDALNAQIDRWIAGATATKADEALQAEWDKIEKIFAADLDVETPTGYTAVRDAKKLWDALVEEGDPHKSNVIGKGAPIYNEDAVIAKLAKLTNFHLDAKARVAALMDEIKGLKDSDPKTKVELDKLKTELNAWEKTGDFPVITEAREALDEALENAYSASAYDLSASNLYKVFVELANRVDNTSEAEVFAFPDTYATAIKYNKVKNYDALTKVTSYDLIQAFNELYVSLNNEGGKAAMKAHFKLGSMAVAEAYAKTAADMVAAAKYIQLDYVQKYFPLGVPVADATKADFADLLKIKGQIVGKVANEDITVDAIPYAAKIVKPADVTALYNKAEADHIKVYTDLLKARGTENFLTSYKYFVKLDGGSIVVALESDKIIADEVADSLTKAWNVWNDLQAIYDAKAGTTSLSTLNADNKIKVAGAGTAPYAYAERNFTEAEYKATGADLLKDMGTNGAVESVETLLYTLSSCDAAVKAKDDFVKQYGSVINADITLDNYAEAKTNLTNVLAVRNSIAKGDQKELVLGEWALGVLLKNLTWDNKTKKIVKSDKTEDFGTATGVRAGNFIDANTQLKQKNAIAVWMSTYAFKATDDKTSLYDQVLAIKAANETVSSDLLAEINKAVKTKIPVYNKTIDLYLADNKVVAETELLDVKKVLNTLKDVVDEAVSDNIEYLKVDYFSYVYGSDEVVVYDAAKKKGKQEDVPTSWKVAQDKRANRVVVNEYKDEVVVPQTNAYIRVAGTMSKAAKEAAKKQPNVIYNGEAGHIELNYTEPYQFLEDVNADTVTITRTKPVEDKLVCFYVPFDLVADSLKGLNVYYVSGAKVDGSAVSFGLTEKKDDDNKLYAFKPYMIKSDESIEDITLALEDDFIKIGNTKKAGTAVVNSIAGGKVVYTMSSSNQKVLAKDYTKGDVDYTRYFWQAGKINHYSADRKNEISYVKPSTLVIDMNVNDKIEYVIGGFYMDGEEDVTGIQNVAAEKAAVEGVYTISGQKVNSMAKPGLYIVNGKKVMVK